MFVLVVYFYELLSFGKILKFEVALYFLVYKMLTEIYDLSPLKLNLLEAVFAFSNGSKLKLLHLLHFVNIFMYCGRHFIIFSKAVWNLIKYFKRIFKFKIKNYLK